MEVLLATSYRKGIKAKRVTDSSKGTQEVYPSQELNLDLLITFQCLKYKLYFSFSMTLAADRHSFKGVMASDP